MDLDFFSSIEPFDPEKEDLLSSSITSNSPTPSSSVSEEAFLSNSESVNDHEK